MKHTEQTLSLNLIDAGLGVWLNNVEEDALKLMMKSLSSMLSKNGWDMYTPYDDHLDVKKRSGVKAWKSWSSRFRRGSKNGLEIKFYVCGRHLEITLFEKCNRPL